MEKGLNIVILSLILLTEFKELKELKEKRHSMPNMTVFQSFFL